MVGFQPAPRANFPLKISGNDFFFSDNEKAHYM